MKKKFDRINTIDTTRRLLNRLILGSASMIPLTGLLRSTTVYADELPHLEKDDPVAKALNYVHDAENAERTDKPGMAGNQQTCANCHFLEQGEDQWLPCQLFPGKAVSVKGWCRSWTHKA